MEDNDVKIDYKATFDNGYTMYLELHEDEEDSRYIETVLCDESGKIVNFINEGNTILGKYYLCDEYDNIYELSVITK